MQPDLDIEDQLVKAITEKKRYFVRRVLKWGDGNLAAFPWRWEVSPYGILISELLLRRTRAEKVAEVFPRFMVRFPSVGDLAASSRRDLEKEIFSLGRQGRGKEILRIAQVIATLHHGVIPSSEKELFDIIGKESRYTVNAILCFGFGERVPIFDVNVNRILSRVLSIDLGSQPYKTEKAWKIAKMLLPSANEVRKFNWALLDLGRTICAEKPRCNICPLADICDYAIKESAGGGNNC